MLILAVHGLAVNGLAVNGLAVNALAVPERCPPLLYSVKKCLTQHVASKSVLYNLRN